MNSSSLSIIFTILLRVLTFLVCLVTGAKAFKPFSFWNKNDPLLLQTETLAPDPNQFQPSTSASVPVFETADLSRAPKGNDITMFSFQNPSPLGLPPATPSLTNFPGKIPMGSYEVISNPSKVRMTIAAKNVELVCSAFGDFKESIRWVRLKKRVNNVQEFEVIANGENSFDPKHFKVKAGRETSRLTIHNLDPALHYGTYQCQVSLLGQGNFIQKLDFNIGTNIDDNGKTSIMAMERIEVTS